MIFFRIFFGCILGPFFGFLLGFRFVSSTGLGFFGFLGFRLGFGLLLLLGFGFRFGFDVLCFLGTFVAHASTPGCAVLLICKKFGP